MVFIRPFVFVIVVILCTEQICGGLIKREEDKHCAPVEPCGWAVYNSSTRKVLYYMKNKCKCADNQKCLRTFDDVSIWSYTYQCKEAS